jgi:HD-GYP domain-containing protein (c-di-GMP phosphodiesterase class II)
MVCDVHDALLSNRVYREAWTREGALGLLREGSGDTLDDRRLRARARRLRRLNLRGAARPAARVRSRR